MIWYAPINYYTTAKTEPSACLYEYIIQVLSVVNYTPSQYSMYVAISGHTSQIHRYNMFRQMIPMSIQRHLVFVYLLSIRSDKVYKYP